MTVYLLSNHQILARTIIGGGSHCERFTAFYGSKSFTFCLQPNTLTWLFSSSHKRQNLLPHHLEREPVLWLSEADRMPQKRWHASSEPKPRGALSTCPCVFVAAMRTRLGYPCGRRHVEQNWIASAAWPKPASISWQKWVRLARTGRTTPVTTGTCEPYLLVVCHRGAEGCVLHSIIVAIGNWHTQLEIESGMHSWKNY